MDGGECTHASKIDHFKCRKLFKAKRSWNSKVSFQADFMLNVTHLRAFVSSQILAVFMCILEICFSQFSQSFSDRMPNEADMDTKCISFIFVPILLYTSSPDSLDSRYIG